MQASHPFAKFIAILGRGKTKSRSLDLEEARKAMGILLQGKALPEQIGAFLMLLRLKEETPQEIAGMALAVKDLINLPENCPKADLDWSSYAGKKRQLPWYVLSALLLAENGCKVFMHGSQEHTPGRVYTYNCLRELGIPVCHDYNQAAKNLTHNNFAYMPIEAISRPLADMIALKPILGLRSPVHSFARMINPFDASAMMVGIFHRGFMDIHVAAAIAMNQNNFTVFRGEGGEAERRPEKTCETWNARNGKIIKERWPAILPAPQTTDPGMNIAGLSALWRGEISSDYGQAAVTGTLAVALRTAGLTKTTEDAQRDAKTMWEKRNKNALPIQL